jgi:hypothetical protein
MVQTDSGKIHRAAHLAVMAIPATEEFERAWGAALAVYQEEVAAPLRAQQAAVEALDVARLEWTKALASWPATGTRRTRRTPDMQSRAQHRDLWSQVRAAEDRLAAARTKVTAVARKHDRPGVELLERHATRRVEADANGQYVLAGLPVGRVYVYARLPLERHTVVWFRPISVEVGIGRLDLTEANSGGWPFGS